jgi:PAS domain S-box-containing protein
MRILVVDDHELVRRGICSVLETNSTLSICGQAFDGKDAVEKAQSLRPDVVVMDISMPRMNGLEATREIKRLIPEVEIVIVTQHESPQMARQAFEAGARGYVVKSSISTELLSAIAKVSGEENIPETSYLPADNGEENPNSIFQETSDVARALRDSEERFRSVTSSMAEGLYTVDTEGLSTYVNPSAEKMFDWKSAELLGKKMHDLTHYKRPDGTPFPAAECPGLQVLQKGTELREHEDVFIRKDGSFFPVVFSASPLRNEGSPVGVVVCFRDDTKRREADSQLQTLVRTLETRIAERTGELQDVTDKLRELSGRLLQTQDEERRRIARELHDGVGQLLVALNLNLSKVNSEKFRLSEGARLSLGENSKLIDQASQEIRTMSHLLHPPLLDEVGLESALRWYVDGFAERSKISVHVELVSAFSEGLPRDLALSIFRIVQECLTNVHRHSGSLTAFVGIERSVGHITLEVKDQGKGIPLEIREKIASGASGGVGLRGMRERIRQFGGRLEVHSGEGSTKVIAVLPIPRAGAEGDAGIVEEDELTGQTEAETRDEDVATILCIDDEAAGLLPRKLLLESAGHRVIEAYSGAEGIRLFRSEKVDAVILDYWMSGMKGTAVAAELKRINPAVPIIVLSGMSDLPGEAAGIVDQWIVKGTTRAEQLLDSVATLLERRAV